MLGGIASLTLCAKDRNNAAHGGLIHSIWCRGRVSGSVRDGGEAAAVSGAAAGCSSPGSSSATIV